MTKEQFAKLMFAMAGNFGTEIQPATLDIWYAMAGTDAISYDQMRAAVQALMRTKPHCYGRMPTYADILIAVRGQTPSVEHRATAEANRIIAHLNRHRNAQVWPERSDPITKYLMTQRWPYEKWASRVKEDELKWWAQEFARAYQAEHAIDQRDLKRLPQHAGALVKIIGHRL